MPRARYDVIKPISIDLSMDTFLMKDPHGKTKQDRVLHILTKNTYSNQVIPSVPWNQSAKTCLNGK